jgi:hypothetical protein
MFEPGSIKTAVVAGNNHGKEIERWRQALTQEIPNIELCLRDVSPRKQAADIALIMELGANLERHRHEGPRVAIVSRDELLISAAEHAKLSGCQVVIAYGYIEHPPARSTQLMTLILPAQENAAALPPDAPENSPKLKEAAASTTLAGSALAKQLRAICTARTGGWFWCSGNWPSPGLVGFSNQSFADTSAQIHSWHQGRRYRAAENPGVLSIR